jgi:hypothetical protein
MPKIYVWEGRVVMKVWSLNKAQPSLHALNILKATGRPISACSLDMKDVEVIWGEGMVSVEDDNLKLIKELK